ncbi:hypothetical protein E1286_04890 [Nonomuraea terrae]|uniref:Uncharacterized protein n=1 Tax=Nonomuraea terrae TaxID=2530383 RepID=A0A4R4ZBI2_9ACTN|nr:helix-turn-helix domain-containing protein [Nonomuraea terrae]TDD54529.1 hypothetical protein E1286_04890 [Nonomuraea terrae]
MSQRPEPPPEGALIKDALTKKGLSARAAATATGISEGRWRQIVSGYQIVSAGTYAPVRGPKDTVARMADVVGLTPEDLEKAGRSDAAEELRAIREAKEASAPLRLLPDEPKSPREVALEQLFESMNEELRQLKARVDTLEADHERDESGDAHRRGA